MQGLGKTEDSKFGLLKGGRVVCYYMLQVLLLLVSQGVI
jgi:hypothetical protein